MTGLPLEWTLLLTVFLFAIGLAGVLRRRDLLMILLSIEIMFNAAGLAFITAGSRWGQPDGQIILAVAAAEVSVGLALAIRLRHLRQTTDIDIDHGAEGG